MLHYKAKAVNLLNNKEINFHLRGGGIKWTRQGKDEDNK